MEEKKFIQVGGSYAFNATGDVRGLMNSGTSSQTMNLIGIPTGTNQASRIGLRIRVKEIQIHFAIRGVVNNAMDNGTTARWALVSDSKPTGTIPTFDDMFNWGSGLVWMPNETNVSRFKVLKQATHQMVVTTITTAGNAATCGPQFQGSWTVRPNKVVIWNSTSTDIASLINQNWYLVMQGDSAGCCDGTFLLKLKYTDA